MNMKKYFAVLGSLLIFGAGFGAAFQQNPPHEKNKVQEKNKVRNGVTGKDKAPLQNRLMFRDENGDGICDSYRDHDNDGIPNGQDPDWSKAKDGKDNPNRSGNRNSGNKNGVRNGQGGSDKWSSQTFRQSRLKGGKGLCVKNGTRGNSKNGGRK